MTYNFLSQTNSSEFNLYEYVDDESLMIEATMGARMEYITNPYSYILTEDFESVRSILKSWIHIVHYCNHIQKELIASQRPFRKKTMNLFVIIITCCQLLLKIHSR